MAEIDLPTVAIGVPCYNRPAMLEQCLASRRAQTYRNISILISDNASTDPGVEAVGRRHAREDARIRYMRQAVNIGATGNFDYLLFAADAPYFMWACDDDWYEPDFVARCVERLEAEGPRVVSVITETQHETPEGPYEFFNQGAAFRKSKSDLAVERMENMAWHVYGNQLYSVHRRDALNYRGRSILAWFGKTSVEHSILLVLAMRGNLVTLPGVGFHKRERTITCALTKWGIYGGAFPKNKLHQRIFGQWKNIRRHVAAYLDYRKIVRALELNIDDEKRVLLALRQAQTRNARDVAIGWRQPVAMGAEAATTTRVA